MNTIPMSHSPIETPICSSEEYAEANIVKEIPINATMEIDCNILFNNNLISIVLRLLY